MTTQVMESPDVLHEPANHRPKVSGGRTESALRRKDRYKNTIEFRLIFAAAFVMFLFTSTLERAMPGRWAGQNSDQSHRKSIIAQAKESAGIAAGYAFMG